MAKMIVEFTDVDEGRGISLETHAETAEDEVGSWSVVFGLAIKHLWQTGELQKYVEHNKEELIANAVIAAQAYHAKMQADEGQPSA